MEQQKEHLSRCVIIAAAPFNNEELDFIKREIGQSDFIICSDGGFEKAISINIIPDLVIGDLDSNCMDIPDEIDTIKLPVKKDDTDTMVCIKKAIELGFEEVCILGGIGGRFDHTFANISALLYAEKHGLKASLKDCNSEIRLVLSENSDSSLLLTDKKGYTVSIFSFAGSSVKLNLNGFEYPLKNGYIYSHNPIGVSNRVLESKACIEVLEGIALIVLMENPQ